MSLLRWMKCHSHQAVIRLESKRSNILIQRACKDHFLTIPNHDMHLNDKASVGFVAINILILSHNFDKTLISLRKPYKDSVWYFIKRSDYMDLLLHLNLAQNCHTESIDDMQLIV